MHSTILSSIIKCKPINTSRLMEHIITALFQAQFHIGRYITEIVGLRNFAVSTLDKAQVYSTNTFLVCDRRNASLLYLPILFHRVLWLPLYLRSMRYNLLRKPSSCYLPYKCRERVRI